MAELTGRLLIRCKCRVQVMLLVDPEGFWFYGPIRVFNELPRRSENWLRDVESHHDRKAYETSLVLNLPAVDRNWINENEARRIGVTYWIEAGWKLVAGAGIEPAQSPVYETGAFPFGDPAIGFSDEWHGVPVLPRGG